MRELQLKITWPLFSGHGVVSETTPINAIVDGPYIIRFLRENYLLPRQMYICQMLTVELVGLSDV